jgi:transcription elongation factor Elf1
MSKELKKRMTVTQYINAGGTRCPRCHSTNVSGASVDVDAGEATQEMGCDDCGAAWLDVYKLTDYILQDPL